jgi:hypothetical protein
MFKTAISISVFIIQLSSHGERAVFTLGLGKLSYRLLLDHNEVHRALANSVLEIRIILKAQRRTEVGESGVIGCGRKPRYRTQPHPPKQQRFTNSAGDGNEKFTRITTRNLGQQALAARVVGFSMGLRISWGKNRRHWQSPYAVRRDKRVSYFHLVQSAYLCQRLFTPYSRLFRDFWTNTNARTL